MTFPVLLNLHGAGLEADSHQVRHMLDAVPDLCAWVLFPSGLSGWSGDDWHVWGLADVTAAVSAIPDWIKSMNWTGPGVDTGKLVVTGHSNGAQGSWFIASHQPDKVMAVAAASGYSSIQNYVPYSRWTEVTPLVESIIQNSLGSYRHELLMSNLKGIPVYQQHGAQDDNVPAYHSRRLSSLITACGWSSQYVELPDRGHWFEGAMTTKPLAKFYKSVLGRGVEIAVKQYPSRFDFVIPNSGDSGSQMGIFVDQLETPDCFGRISMQRDDEGHEWQMTTSNVRRMHFCFNIPEVQRPKNILIDGDSIRLPSELDEKEDGIAVARLRDKWKSRHPVEWKTLQARFGRQRGCLDAILRTVKPFVIRYVQVGYDSFDDSFDDPCAQAAVQVSRNLMQYYGADAEVVEVEEGWDDSHSGNVITLAIGKVVPPALIFGFPIDIDRLGIVIRSQWPQYSREKRISHQPGLGAAFLRPRPDEKLELVLWGSDHAGLQQAMRMFPTLTGGGQPDFIILGNEARWKGCGGVLAMGFFDHSWQISQASYVPR
jgi:predicted esterase